MRDGSDVRERSYPQGHKVKLLSIVFTIAWMIACPAWANASVLSLGKESVEFGFSYQNLDFSVAPLKCADVEVASTKIFRAARSADVINKSSLSYDWTNHVLISDASNNLKSDSDGQTKLMASETLSKIRSKCICSIRKFLIDLLSPNLSDVCNGRCCIYRKRLNLIWKNQAVERRITMLDGIFTDNLFLDFDVLIGSCNSQNGRWENMFRWGMTNIFYSDVCRKEYASQYKVNTRVIYCNRLQPCSIRADKRLPGNLSLSLSSFNRSVGVYRAETRSDSDHSGQDSGGEPIPPLAAAMLFFLGVPAFFVSWFRGPTWLFPVSWISTVVGAIGLILWVFPIPS